MPREFQVKNMSEPLGNLPRHKVLWLLFKEFFLIATFVVGGGYAIILAAERIFVRKLHWMNEDELPDVIAMSQTIPGLTAGNAAIYVGLRTGGRLGALVALLGVALPSFLIILLLASLYEFLPLDWPPLQGAFVGVRSALAGLTVAALLRLWPRVMKNVFTYVIAFGCLIGVLGFGINPGWLLLGSMVVGVAALWLRLPVEITSSPEGGEHK